MFHNMLYLSMNIQPQGKVLSVNLRKGFLCINLSWNLMLKKPEVCASSWSTTTSPLHPQVLTGLFLTLFFPYSSSFWCFCHLLNLFSQGTTSVTEGLSLCLPAVLQNLSEPAGTSCVQHRAAQASSHRELSAMLPAFGHGPQYTFKWHCQW